MGFQIGAFRFDRGQYNTYIMYFKDISGLSRKAEVKVAGVKVGWVERTSLLPDQMCAEAEVLIKKEYKLYQDAYAIVRQDGLLGPKYLEVVPGSPLLAELQPGETLKKPSVEPVNIDSVMHQVKNIATHVEKVSQTFSDVLGDYEGKEQVRSIIHNIGETVQNMSDFTERMESTIVSVEDAANQARDGLKSITSVADKIDEGKGLIGKLVNEEETYHDLKNTMNSIKNYFTQVETLQIVFDAHVESMHRPAENYEFEDSKGYLEVRIHPNEDHFYVFQIATSEKGWVYRNSERRQYFDDCGNEVDPFQLNLEDTRLLEHVFDFKREIYERNTIRFGLQFGKIFGDIALRIGMFEGTAGLGVDFDIPFDTEKFRWVTTFEAFDLTGWNRRDDRRPHLKWINRMFMLRSIYLTFGADDFVSKNNANAFFGAGIRFGDDDAKYLLSNFSTALSSISSNYPSVVPVY